MLKQTRPAKFRVPIKYVDLSDGKELEVPEVLQRQSSGRFASLPFKTVQRRKRLNTIKKANAELSQSLSKSDSTVYANNMLPRGSTQNLVSLCACLLYIKACPEICKAHAQLFCQCLTSDYRIPQLMGFSFLRKSCILDAQVHPHSTSSMINIFGLDI